MLAKNTYYENKNEGLFEKKKKEEKKNANQRNMKRVRYCPGADHNSFGHTHECQTSFWQPKRSEEKKERKKYGPRLNAIPINAIEAFRKKGNQSKESRHLAAAVNIYDVAPYVCVRLCTEPFSKFLAHRWAPRTDVCTIRPRRAIKFESNAKI